MPDLDHAENVAFFNGLRSFPSIALRISIVHNFTRALKMTAFLRLNLAIEVNGYFVENEHGNLSFVLTE